MVVAQGQSISHVVKNIHTYPMLRRDEEFELAERWRDEGDLEAAHRMATSHLRLVAKIASGYANYGIPLDDLMSEGYIGLIQAINRFEPERGFRLSTYAIWWIRASILEYILRSRSLVKIGTTVAQKKLFFNLAKVKNEIKAIDGEDLSIEAVGIISKRLGVTAAEVESMNQRLSSADVSLNTFVGDSENVEKQDQLVDTRDDQETVLGRKEEFNRRRHLVRQAMRGLNDRERDIFAHRRLNEDQISLRELGEQYGVSPERIRQIESNAFRKVQKAVRRATLMGA